MNKIQKRNKLWAFVIFIFGIIITIFLQKISDTIYPSSNEVVVKKFTDTIFVKVVNENNEKLTNPIFNSSKKELTYWKKKSNSNLTKLKTLERKIEIIRGYQLDRNKHNKVNDLDYEDNEFKKEVENSKMNISKQEIFIADKGENKVIPKINVYFPMMEGYQYSNNGGNLLKLECPDLNNKSKYINLDFVIKDKNLLNKIAVIFVSMTEKKNNQLYNEYETFYEPQYGLNHLRVRNMKSRHNKKQYKFYYGIILKSEYNKKYPTTKGIICHFER